MAVTTDIIVGFPGESEAEFEESLNFVRRMNFAGGHVFSYSPRPGTPAANLPDDVPKPLKKARSAQMRALLAESERHYQQQFIDTVLPVLWESASEGEGGRWAMKGLSDNYLRIRATAGENLWNKISQVRVTGVEGGVLDGKIVG
jgi:threonylcarbamoyladenosine tRNA methylthiotransferase MtaB